ncbi:unnamed protein product [Candidula unifasciata]|uniref:Thioredoxin domain-containing protein n=1 Tax=Candidula unifasciata TaxID=100452 RepID=A0A8S4AA85_9EUPU|nr:unnamed protein product [Candidula unifasciata]
MTSPLRPPPTPGPDNQPKFIYSPGNDLYEAPAHQPLIPQRTTSLKPRTRHSEVQAASSEAVTPKAAADKKPRTLVPAPPRVPKPPVLRDKPHHQEEQQPPKPLPRRKLPPSAEGEHIYVNAPSHDPQLQSRMPTFPRPSETHAFQKLPTNPDYNTYESVYKLDSTFDSVDHFLDATVDTSSASQFEQPMSEVSKSSAASVETHKGTHGVYQIQIDPSVGSESTVTFDPYVGSNHVYSLNEYNIDTIAFSDNPAMVFFYDPTDPNTVVTRDQFKKAADSKTTYNHNYGAVNCLEDPEFCDKWQINQIPMIKVFNEGRVVSTVREMKTFDSKAMTKFLDTLVTINQSTASKSNERSTTSTKSKCSIAKMFGFKK